MQKHISTLLIFIISHFLLFGCAATPENLSGPVIVAVWDMEDLSCKDSSGKDLGQILSAEIIESLKTIGGYQVVERQRLLLVLEELNFGSSSLADKSTRLHIGKIAGATCMVFGGYQIIGDAMRIDLRLVDVSSGKIMHASGKTASSSNLTEWLSAARDAAADLVQQ